MEDLAIYVTVVTLQMKLYTNEVINFDILLYA